MASGEACQSPASCLSAVPTWTWVLPRTRLPLEALVWLLFTALLSHQCMAGLQASVVVVVASGPPSQRGGRPQHPLSSLGMDLVACLCYQPSYLHSCWLRCRPSCR
jgi:hypothetical protein